MQFHASWLLSSFIRRIVFYANWLRSTNTELNSVKQYSKVLQRFRGRTIIPFSLKQQIFSILSIAAIIANFIPLLLVLIKKLWKEIPFVLFGIYWMIGGIVNLLDVIPGLSQDSREIITVVYNMLDVPMVLALLYFSTTSTTIRKFTRFTAPVFLAVQLVNFFSRGWNYDAAKYVMAVGLLLVLTVIIWEISLYMQKLEHTPQENALIFIHVSLMFAYGTFVIIYIFDYYIKVSNSGMDNFLIYYVSTLVAIIIASFGYLMKRTPAVPAQSSSSSSW